MSYEPQCLKRWQRPDSWGGKPWFKWYVGLGRHRDSDLLTISNFEVFAARLLEVSSKTVDDMLNADYSFRTRSEDWSEVPSVYIVNESHWAVGWIQWVAIHESDEVALREADEMMAALEDYPVLSEDDFSEREYNEVIDYWSNASLSERISWCKECEISIFASRNDEIPERVFDYLRDRL